MDNFDKKIKEELEKIEIPEEKVYQAIEDGLNRNPKKKPFWMRKSFLAVVCLAILGVGGLAIYNQKLNDYASSENQSQLNSKTMLEKDQKTDEFTTNEMSETTDQPESKANNEAVLINDPSRKIVSTISMELESKEFSTSIKDIETIVKNVNGYIENYSLTSNSEVPNPEIKGVEENSELASYSNGRSTAEFVLRIPTEKVAEALPLIEKSGKIVSQNKTNQDVTLSYQDTESRKKVLLLEQEKLLELLGKAANVDEMIVLEKRLSEVRVELESLESQLRSFDNQIDYTTIFVSVRDVKTYTESLKDEAIGERISEGFKNNLNQIGVFFTDAFVWIMVNSLYLLLIAVLGFSSYLVIKKKKSKKIIKKRG